MSLAKQGSFLLILLLYSCAGTLNRPLAPTEARLGEHTALTDELRELPPPSDPIVVAVYQFRDQTGQYKEGGGFSTAVTQGATNILVRAMKDSGWFLPIERENLNNLLNERKIIRSTWNQYGVQETLQPLLYANLIFEGGIVSFDTNVLTGGTGLRYFGAGGSEQYRQDRVTVYLRAVNVNTGEVVKTVYTSKTVLSQAVDVGIFRFVSFRRLLEFETGITYNEPSEMAVTEAIEKAVVSMVVEGLVEGLWSLQDSEDAEHPIFNEYFKEQANNGNRDVFGKELAERRAKFGVTASATGLLYQGDYPDPRARTGGEIGVQLQTSPRLGWQFTLGTTELVAGRTFYQSFLGYADASVQFKTLPYDKFSPFFFAGGGLLQRSGDKRFRLGGGYFPKVQIGLGLEVLMNERLGLSASLGYHLPFTDQLDEVTQGKYNDFYYQGKIGFTYYLGTPVAGARKFK